MVIASVYPLLLSTLVLAACSKSGPSTEHPEPADAEHPEPADVEQPESGSENAVAVPPIPLLGATPLTGPLADYREVCTRFGVPESVCDAKMVLTLDMPGPAFEAVLALPKAGQSYESMGCDFGVKVGGKWYINQGLSPSCYPEVEPFPHDIAVIAQAQGNPIVSIDYVTTTYDTGGYARTTTRTFCGVGPSGIPSCTEEVGVADEEYDRDTEETDTVTYLAELNERGVLRTSDAEGEYEHQLDFQ